MSAILMATFAFLSKSTMASSEPIVSHFNTTPLVCVLLTIAFLTSDSTSDFRWSAPLCSSSDCYCKRIQDFLPALPQGQVMLSSSLKAATTSLTCLNLSRGSRISSRGFGNNNAFIPVEIASSRLPTTMLSP